MVIITIKLGNLQQNLLPGADLWSQTSTTIHDLFLYVNEPLNLSYFVLVYLVTIATGVSINFIKVVKL